jgi:hypothetical protein
MRAKRPVGPWPVRPVRNRFTGAPPGAARPGARGAADQPPKGKVSETWFWAAAPGFASRRFSARWGQS